jgi:hypothetical protein
MTARLLMAGALGAPMLMLALSSGAAGGAIVPGTVGLVSEDVLTSTEVFWPTADFGRNLCPGDLVEAADCKIGPRLGGGGLRPGRVVVDALPAELAPSGSLSRVDVRFGELAGELVPIATACGVWVGSYELDPTGPPAIFPLWLTAESGVDGGTFVGSFEAVVRFDFFRESDGRRVTLVRTLEGPANGTWGLLPEGEVPFGNSNLRLNLGAPRPPFWRTGFCRLKEPPHGQE